MQLRITAAANPEEAAFRMIQARTARQAVEVHAWRTLDSSSTRR